MQVEVGLGQPVAYTDHERRLIATPRGRATRRSPGWSRRSGGWRSSPSSSAADALGLLAHGDREDVYTRSRAELTALIQIAMGGQVAEEMFFGDVSTGPAGDLRLRDQGRGADGRRRRHDATPWCRTPRCTTAASATPTWSAGSSATRRAGAGSRSMLQAAEGRRPRAARGQPAPGGGAARRAARAARADRPRDHRRPRAGRGGRAAGQDFGERTIDLRAAPTSAIAVATEE